MYNMIERFMNNLSISDVDNFAMEKNIHLSNEELNFTYEFIKKNWRQIIKSPESLDLDRYKSKYTEENFHKIKILFKEYSLK